MREKLSELMKGVKYTVFPNGKDRYDFGVHHSDHIFQQVDDHLLANGVIVLPCKVGQKVWDICEFLGEDSHPEMYEMQADEMTVSNDGWFVYDGVSMRHEDFGRIFFTSREEAEAALKEGQE